MPLINCPDCGTEVSDAAPNCPKCNRPIAKAERSKLWPWVGVMVALFVYPFVVWIVFEVVQTVTEGLGLPEWFPGLALLLLLIAFPIVLILVWRRTRSGIGTAGS